MTDLYWVDYRGHNEAKFTVAPRVMTTLTNPIQQKELLTNGCANDNAARCGFALATVTDTCGKGRKVSVVVNNSTESNTKSTYQITGSESATIGGVFEIDLAIELENLGFKSNETGETVFNRSTTSSTTTVNSFEIPIPAHHRGWIEGASPMAHTEGTIIVCDGSRYCKLTNFAADLPSSADPWV
jgi:hypothetical protein